jgi:undecaprenyl-diphosphatase
MEHHNQVGKFNSCCLLKNIFQRRRPQEMARRIKLPDSHSFPSGHSLLSAATYPIVAHHFVQKRSVAAQGAVHTLVGLAILTVGFSRIYFGVHFPSDVFGGFAAGFGWLGLTALSHTVVDRSKEP